MTDTRCPAVAIVGTGIIRCSADDGHRSGHYHEDGWGEILWHWTAGTTPREVIR